MIKRILTVILFLFVFSLPVAAEETSPEDFYSRQFDLSGADELENYLSDDTKEYIDQNGLNPENSNWLSSISPENVFVHIWEFLKSGAKKPLAAGGGILAVILISAALGCMEIKGGSATAVDYATTLTAAAVIVSPAFSVISASVKAMQGCAFFMTAFIPVFAVIVASAGKAATSLSMSTLLLGASQAVSYISNFVVVPLLGGYMAISLAASVSPIISRSGIAEGIKKLSFWIMSLITTVFVGILSIQTAVNASADTLSLKTAKFIIGSSFPVAGAVLSEALTTVTASMGLLKSTVGVYGVIACCTIFLPLLAELLIWRVILILTACVSDLFSLPKISVLLRCVDTVMSVITGIILLTCAMFVISITVVLTVGKA